MGPEDKLHKEFAKIIRQYEGYKQLNCMWWSYDASGEKRSDITGSLLKSKGLTPGKSDYEFRINKQGIMHHIYLEFKVGKNKQSENQKDFESLCKGITNNRYHVAYSLEEGLGVLKLEGVIK